MKPGTSPASAVLLGVSIVFVSAIGGQFTAQLLSVSGNGPSPVVSAAISAVLAVPALWFGLVRPVIREKRAADQTLHDVAEALGEGFQMYDPDDRLVICNTKYREIYAHSSRFNVVGRTFEEIVRDTVAHGVLPQADGREEEFIAERMRLHRELGDPIERRLASGTWVKVTETRTSTGYTVGIRADITEMKAREQRLIENEALLRSILDNSPFSICLKDSDSRFLFINKQFADWYGLDPETTIGKDSYDIFAPESARAYIALDQEALRSKKPSIREFEAKMVDGQTRFILTTKFPVIAPDDRVLGVGLISTDITELRLREAELAEKTALLQTVLDAVPAMITVLDNENRVTFVSRMAAEHYGQPADALVGRTPKEFLGGIESDHRFFKFIDDIRQSGHTIHRANYRSSLHPDRVHWSLGTPVVGTDGEMLGVLLVALDVTEQQNAVDELARASKLEGIGRLAAGIAHEINTPIQYIGDNLGFLSEAGNDMFELVDAFLEYLEVVDAGGDVAAVRRRVNDTIARADVGFLKEDVPEAIERSQHGVADVARIVLSMKDFSHPTTRDKTPVDINSSLRNTVVISRNEWKQVALVDENLSDDLPDILGHPGEINQVFLNIIVNAAHAIADRGDAALGKITVASARKGDDVEVRISDTGTGLPEEVRDKVFEPFYTTKEVGKGTGQGLAISWDIVVNKHGGTIEIESETGKGTTFILTFPGAVQLGETSAAIA